MATDRTDLVMDNNIKYDIFGIACLFFISALLMNSQLLSTGYFSVLTDDTFAYTSWASQFKEALREGVSYPRWMPLDFFGYGRPAFICYPPLAFYAASFFTLATGSIVSAMNLTKFVAFFGASAGVFYLLREFYSSRTALLSALLYAIFPLNVFELYATGGFACVVSKIWFCPILLLLNRYYKSGRIPCLMLSAVCFAGLMCTHLINAYMFVFVIAVFAAERWIRCGDRHALAVLPIILGVALLVSAAYTLPMLLERQFVDYKAFIRTGIGYNYSDYFILPNRTEYTPSDHFWALYYETYDLFSIICCICLLLYIRLNNTAKDTLNTEARLFNASIITVSLFSLFLLFWPSIAIWETVPFFKYIQFPKRWLTISALSIALLSTVLTTSPANVSRKIIISVLVIAFILLDFKTISTAYIFSCNKLAPARGVNTSLEHLPAGVSFGAIAQGGFGSERVTSSGGTGQVTTELWNSAERRFGISAQQPLTLRIRTFAFPGWTAYLDDRKTPLSAEKETHAILVAVPAGIHQLRLAFEDTPVRRYGKVVSIVSVVVLLLGLIKGYVAPRKENTK